MSRESIENNLARNKIQNKRKILLYAYNNKEINVGRLKIQRMQIQQFN